MAKKTITDTSYEDIKKLEDCFKKMGGNKGTIGLSLVNEAYFLCKTLSRLKELLEGDIVERFEQGKQNFLREHPALKSYNTTLKNYQGVMKQLYDIVPDNGSIPDDEKEFQKMMMGK